MVDAKPIPDYMGSESSGFYAFKKLNADSTDDQGVWIGYNPDDENEKWIVEGKSYRYTSWVLSEAICEIALWEIDHAESAKHKAY